MTTATAAATHEREQDRGRTLAQWYCYVIGAVLTLAGIFGFTADATFDTSGSKSGDDIASGNANNQLQGDGFLGFEVNGWHNVVHLVSGIILLLLASKRGSARTGAIVFGAVYLVLTIIGLIDGNDILNFVPVNAADNVLHIALSALGLIAGLISKGGPERDQDHNHERDRGERVDPPAAAPVEPERNRARESYQGTDDPGPGPQGTPEPRGA